MSEIESDSLFSQAIGDTKINLSIGAPGPDLLAKLSPMFSEGCSNVLTSGNSDSLFQYGPETGTKHYRRELSQFLSSHYGAPVNPDQLVLTTGATNGLHLAVSSLVRRGGVVFVENPTYFIALDILKKDLGLEVVPVNMTEDGVDVDSLESKIQSAAGRRKTELEEDDGRYWGLYYSIPTFHNPTGVTFTESVMSRIVEISEKYKVLVICDDVYNLLPYSGQPAVRLKSLDRAGNVLSNGTFSKILCPGVRLGWLEAPPRLVSRLEQSGVLLSGGSQNHWMSGLVANLLETGALSANLTSAIQTYTDRMEAALSVLSQLSGDWRVVNPGGGYFLWLSNTTGADLEQFCSWLEREKGVAVLRGSKACPYSYLGQNSGGCCRGSLRLSIAYYQREDIVRACNIICEAIREYFV